MSIQEQRSRISLFDNIKFFLMLLVVVGHFADVKLGQSDIYKSLGIFIYTFHMPLFIFITGLFNKNKDPRNKTVMFIILGFATKIGLSVASVFINGSTSFKVLGDGGLPWFMFVIGGYYFISYLLKDVDKRLVLIMSVLLACFAGYDESIGDYLYLSRTINLYPFFVLGEMVSKESIIKINKNKWLKLLGFCLVSAFAVLCFIKPEIIVPLRPIFTGRASYIGKEMFEVNGGLYRILCYVITVIVSFGFVCMIPSGNIPVISKFGSRTLQVYFWHWTFVVVLSRIEALATFYTTPAGKLVWLLMGVALTFILSLKPFGFPVVQIMNMCKKKNG